MLLRFRRASHNGCCGTFGLRICAQMSCRLETTVLCLAIRTRAYDDLTFHLSSIAFALHCPIHLGGSSYLPGLARCPKCPRSICRHQINQSLCDGSMVLQDFDLSGLGAALLRFILAGFWIAHWWYKVGYRGMPATQAFFLQQGLPVWLAWFDVSFELVVAVCLVLGIFVPLLCLISLPILFASMWIYRRNGFYFSSGGIELPLLWACAQIAQAMLGPGAFRVSVPLWLPQLPVVFGAHF